MACANRMHSSVFTTPAPILGRWCRPSLMKTIIAIAEAFQEALEMRRSAHRTRYLNDE